MNRLYSLLIVGYAVGYAGCLAGSARAQSGPEVPDTLRPPSGEALVLKVHASGDQIYVCQSLGWKLKAPEAKLYDPSNVETGHHFAGPTWEFKDGSRIKGKLAASEKSPDESAIPWLLITVIEHEGTGIVSNASSIQRIHTKGGIAPREGCDAGHEESTVRSPYEADYYFYARPK